MIWSRVDLMRFLGVTGIETFALHVIKDSHSQSDAFAFWMLGLETVAQLILLQS